VRARDGSLVPLSSLVSVTTTQSLFAITRRSRERAISVFANVGPGGDQATAVARARTIAEEALAEIAEKRGLPLASASGDGGAARRAAGYTVALSGQSQALEESFSELTFALLLGVAVAYMILASQFNSFVHPVTVLVALPFSLTGALAALALAGLSLNLYSFIGLVLLMGIVKKNSILLVDFTNQRRLEGLSTREALVAACPMRLRPILMTTTATIAGALPAAIAAGPGGEVRQPMAVAVLGGLVVSTCLTLFVVPALYSLFDSLTARLSKRSGHEREALKALADLEAESLARAGAGAPRGPPSSSPPSSPPSGT
jgi:HAE1 family hydrophobic/amphiphilic exporter-1